MKNFVMAILYGTIIFFVSCEKEDLSAEKANVAEAKSIGSEIYTLNSKDNKGFSVEYLRLADSPGIKPDFIIIPQTGLTGDILSPFLSHPNFERRFILSKEFNDSSSAQAYFDSYNVAPEGEPLRQFALDLKANQIWLVKTRSGDFCKVLIIGTKINRTTDFVEIRFKAARI